jgi:hypothetical protein
MNKPPMLNSRRCFSTPPSSTTPSSFSARTSRKAIDGLSDDLASATDQESRKHRLLKGPEEFREVRVDRTKK